MLLPRQRARIGDRQRQHKRQTHRRPSQLSMGRVVLVGSFLKVKMYSGHVESDFVLQNSRYWQDILT